MVRFDPLHQEDRVNAESDGTCQQVAGTTEGASKVGAQNEAGARKDESKYMERLDLRDAYAYLRGACEITLYMYGDFFSSDNRFYKSPPKSLEAKTRR